MLLNRLWNASIHTRIFLRRWMPTNILLDRLRIRRCLRWGGSDVGTGDIKHG